MLKLVSLKTISAAALSLSLLLGALVATPVTSAFAKAKFFPAKDVTTGTRGSSYSNRDIDNDHDELNESSEKPMIVYSSMYFGRAEGKRTFDVGK